MSKISFTLNAITGLADFVLNNYEQIKTTIKNGIALTIQTYKNIKLSYDEIIDLLRATAGAMQSVENEGVLVGKEKKVAVLDFIEKEYAETRANIKLIWSDWKVTVSNYIDQLISMLNSGKSVLTAFLA